MITFVQIKFQADKAEGLKADSAEKVEHGHVMTHKKQQEVVAKEGRVVGQHTVDELSSGQLRHLTQVETNQEVTTTTLKRTTPLATQTAELQPRTVGVRASTNPSTACKLVCRAVA